MVVGIGKKGAQDNTAEKQRNQFNYNNKIRFVSVQRYSKRNSKQDTNKNVKNVKNVKNKTYTSDFISFWDCYPKKVAKDAAWKSWQKRNGERPDIAVLISAVENQKKSEQWAKDGGQFIPHPASWLNQGRWDDEAPAQENNSALDRNDPVFKS